MRTNQLLAYASPFKDYKEFAAAKGPIYTFAHTPGTIAFFLVVTALLSLYFVYASYSIKARESSAKSPLVLSILLALGMISIAERAHSQFFKNDRPTAAVTRSAEAKANGWQALGLLGLIGGGTATRLSQQPKRPRRRVRANNRQRGR